MTTELLIAGLPSGGKTAPRSTSTPIRMSATAIEATARAVLRRLVDEMSDEGGQLQRYADLVDIEAVCKHAAKLAYAAGSEVIREMSEVQTSPTALAKVLTKCVEEISEGTVRGRVKAAKLLRQRRAEAEAARAEADRVRAEAERQRRRPAPRQRRGTVRVAELRQAAVAA